MKIASLLFTLQLAHAVKPMFSSGTQYFSVAESNVLPDRSLKNATFKVYFDKPVIEFDQNDIAIEAFICGSSSNCTSAPDNFRVQVTSWQELQGGQQYHFKLNTDSANMIDLSTVKLKLSTPPGACKAQVSSFECEASAYTIYYAGGLSFTSTTSIAEQQVNLNLNFNLDYFNLNGEYFPFKVTVNDDAAPFGSYTMIMINNELNAMYYGAEPSDKVCLEVTTDLPAVGNIYGDYIITGSYTPVCFTVSAEACGTYTWAEWSGCTFECLADDKFAADNTQTRIRVYPETNCPVVNETRSCAITYPYPCELLFKSAVETGSECHPVGGEFKSDTCSVGRVVQDCYCGGDCVEKGNCCQSYYKNCLTDAKNDPSLFYKYAPCWEPHKCKAVDEPGMPYCDASYTTDPRGGPANFANSVMKGNLRLPVKTNTQEDTCDPLALARNVTRGYKYACTCFGVLNNGGDNSIYTCDNYQFPGFCCGGKESFANSCPDSYSNGIF